MYHMLTILPRIFGSGEIYFRCDSFSLSRIQAFLYAEKLIQFIYEALVTDLYIYKQFSTSPIFKLVSTISKYVVS